MHGLTTNKQQRSNNNSMTTSSDQQSESDKWLGLGADRAEKLELLQGANLADQSPRKGTLPEVWCFRRFHEHVSQLQQL
jgi:hypothetical protein